MKTSHLLIVPDHWDETLKSACLDYFNHRKKTKHPLTETAWTWFKNKIERYHVSYKYTSNEIAEAIGKSIINNWRDVYLQEVTHGEHRRRLMMEPEVYYDRYTEDERQMYLNA